MPRAAKPTTDAAPPSPAPTATPPVDPQVAATPLDDTLPGLAEETDWLATGYYGLEGSGKSANLASMARLGKVLLVNAESGMKPRALARLGIPTGPDRIRVWPDQAKGEALDYASFEQLYFRLKADLMRDPTSWIGIGLDSLTEIVRLLISSERQIQYEQAVRRGKERRRFFTDRDDYGTVTAQVSDLLRRFRYLPCHFAFTALERRDDDGQYGPGANPGIANDLPAFVDLLVHCETQEIDDGEPVFVGWTKKHDRYRAKDRYGWLPRAIPDPWFDRLFDYARETLTPDADEKLQDAKKRRAAAAQDAAAQT